MQITINPPKDLTIVQEMKRTIDTITIRNMIDSPEQKQVVAETMELGRIILWQKEAYDNIGQWTDTDVIDRIKEIYNI